ncbi:MAG TPA: TonB-dependent receptor plug domain-containing protein [Mucilaginibacter sp.]|jgi:hypothetical protein|nr:TonB-dependent receptor plug domain-containing protein [Mucilaginibacter sp.]
MALNFKPGIFICALILAVNSYAWSQTDSSFLSHAAEKLSQQPAIEKVYLHLDKPGGYFSGDTIWYKAYTVVGQHHQLSALSGVLYIELISPKDTMITRQTLHLLSGVAWGEIPLARGLRPGNYRIRAYTNWMRNTPDYFYDQRIRIGGISPGLTTPVVGKSPDVQFFPEGGNLVTGVRSRIAIKSVGANGLGEDIQGSIEDNEGNVVADFATSHLGMGVFALIPQSGKTYKAKINVPGETTFTVDLPKAMDAGYTLALNNSSKDSIYIKIAVNDKVLNEQRGNTFYIIAQNSDKVYYTSRGKLEGLIYIAKVEKSRFPTGIAQFTLFSQNGEPLAERIAFIKSADTLQLHLNTDNQAYATRGKVKLDLSTTDKSAKSVPGSFSVAVINESRAGINENNENTILSTLLLTSDLKGYVEQPNYYFINIDDQKMADLDVLMLTQGYRRFELKKILNDAPTAISFQPQKSIELSGELKTPSGKPIPNGKVILAATREKFIVDTVADFSGKFKFTNLDLSDTSKIVLRGRKENNGSNVMIYVKQQEYPPVTNSQQKQYTDIITGIKLSPEMLKNIEGYQAQVKEDSLKKLHELSGVSIKAKKAAKPDKYNGYGTALEKYIDMSSLSNYINVDQVIKDLVHTRDDQAWVIVIDGLELYDRGALATYSPSEIQSIKVSEVGGYSPEYRTTSAHYVVIETKRYAGTDTTTLKEVKITAKKAKKGPDLSHSDNLNGPGNADQVIMGETISGCITLSDCLTGKVFGVTFGSDGAPHSTRTGGRLGGSPPAMVVIVDGSVLPGSSLNQINAVDIYSIEVLRSGSYLALYGSNAPGGALVITTRRGGDSNYVTSTIPAGLITYPFKGYFRAKTFYTPKYTHAKRDGEPYDLRSTIYWNPNVITDKDGKASFEYFNADTRGTYRVVVEGIDDNGNLGRQVYRYKVE